MFARYMTAAGNDLPYSTTCQEWQERVVRDRLTINYRQGFIHYF